MKKWRKSLYIITFELFSDISEENIVAGQRKMMLEWGEHVHRLGGQNTEGNSEDSGEI